MGRVKTLFFCFLFAGILFFRSTSGRSIHLSARKDVKSLARNGSDPPVSPERPYIIPAGSPEGENDGGQVVHKEERHHRSSDKSVAGGGVIIGGLVTATFAALYCYIRVTRKKHGDALAVSSVA